ncbi:MAG: FliM/FliN family flagellar motor C-terminal domain-containing protein [Paracoccus sp. (in: a-proteobacteria)]|uniref:FliM/FliN family flagellar motor C-terminal domain-containing protein n=1 Tax=Paracoccus sp. TaxID=267 RepID=UPI0026E04940|nr:FliM/FliN family flagellar motor C-terminal domain-containing protein [Paracoccus sp. (in: a-proteobacteria)]MDO5621665.1 FliM/FliN family flagellar motor C-terminal domain-containing protein [Paracoccus sp. (in: a-proteobacteria)]
MNDIESLILTDHIKVEVSIRLGATVLSVGEISALRADDVLPLAQGIEDGVELCIGERIIARGEIVRSEADGKLAIRILGQAASA